MKQSLIAIGLVAAGMLAPQTSHAQAVQCLLVCNPPRVICFPAGTQLPPLTNYCRTGGSNSATAPSEELSLAPDLVSQGQNSCSAQEVFNEDTQSVESVMVCN